MLLKCCTQYASKFGKLKQWPQDRKRLVFITISKKSKAKDVQPTTQLYSSHKLKMLKILQARLQSTWIMNFQIFKLDLEKGQEPEIKFPTSVSSSKKQQSSRKTFTSALLTTPKSLTVWITTKYRKFFKKWEHQTILPATWEIHMQVKKQQLELDMK